MKMSANGPIGGAGLLKLSHLIKFLLATCPTWDLVLFGLG
jgi:hypothetical protein